MPRNSSHIIQVVSPPDYAIIRIIQDCFNTEIVSKASISISPFSNYPIKSLDDLHEFAGKLGDLNAKRIRNAQIFTNHHIRCNFDRSVTRGSELIPALYEAEFYFHVPQGQQADEAVATQLADSISRHCGSASNEIQIGPTPLASAIASHVESLASVATRISERLASAQFEYDKRLQDHLKRLEEQTREQELVREKQHQERLNELEKKQNQLEQKESELDLGRARDARRKLREDITTNLKERLIRPQPSFGTRLYRVGVISVTIAGTIIAVISAGLAITSVTGVSLERLLSSQENTRTLSLGLGYARFFASSALAAVLIFYLLSYLKRIELQDIRFERDLERYSLDIDRASWVIETVMEFRDEENGLPVPDVWLNGVTSNLFDNSEPETPDDESTLAALGEILKSGARFKIGNGTAELELDPNASKRIAKSK